MNCEAGIFVDSAVRASPWLQLFHAEQKKCPLVMIWRMLSAGPAGCMQSGGLVNSAESTICQIDLQVFKKG